MARAVALAQAALRDGIEDPLVLNLVAHQLEEEGRYSDAMAMLDRAIGLDRGNILIWNAIGLCLVKQERRDEAVKAFGHALSLAPHFNEARINLAASLDRLGDLGNARLHYEEALRRDERTVDALAGLASLDFRAGNIVNARYLAQRARNIRRDHAQATEVLARIDLAEGGYDAAERRLSEICASGALGPMDRSVLLGLLGDALDGLGRIDQAFDAYQQGKAALRAAYRSILELPGRESEWDRARRLKAYFDCADPSDWRSPQGAEPVRHAFLVGFPRSGTTLLETMFAAHPDVVTIDERDTLLPLEERFFSDRQSLERLKTLSAAEAAELAAAYWSGIEKLGFATAGKLVIDKMPLYSLRLPLIAKLFPGARILFAQRDPRDVVLSCFRRAFQINSAMYEFASLEGAARYYDAVMALAGTYRQKIGLVQHLSRYESVIADFEAEARAVCEFLSLDYHPAMAAIEQTASARSIRSPSAAQLRRGLYREGQGQWRRYERHLEPVMELLRPWVEKFAY